MKILITGSSGFIGKNLVEYYTIRGHEVFNFTRDKNLMRSLSEFSPDAIINSAAEIYDHTLMFDSNIGIVQTCLNYVKNNPMCKMIQIGSSSEYGPSDHATNEFSLLKPIDVYQATKGAATLMCQGWARQFDLPIWVVRPYSVYGNGEREKRLFPTLYRAFTYNEPMTLYQGYHDFIYIKDFVRGIDYVLNQWDQKFGEIFNFGSGVQTSNFELLEIFENITGHKAPVTKVSVLSKTFEHTTWVCDTNKTTKLGFRCDYDIETGIKDFLMKAKYDRTTN